MAEVFLIDKFWSELPWFSTGGTREKKYLESPEGKYYYFKKSEFKPAQNGFPEKHYKYEFWSEIIASKVGVALGFNVLDYNIAIQGDVIGCICQSMIDTEKDELIEGISYLQGYSSSFNPEQNKSRKDYTFNLISHAFAHFSLNEFMPDFLTMLVFDAIIGNGDRHQENWAMICATTPFSELLQNLLKQDGLTDLKSLKNLRLEEDRERHFSPFYDNGSSLGRELNKLTITKMALDESAIYSYILKGKSEIHWENRKVSHFDLIRNLLLSSYGIVLKEIIHKLVSRCDNELIWEIIYNIDAGIPILKENSKLSIERKQVIYKIITLRCKELSKLVSERF